MSILIQAPDMGNFRNVKKYCLECGKQLILTAQIHIETKKFCSRHCLGINNRKNGRIKSRGSTEYKKVVKQCLRCGKQLQLHYNKQVEIKKFCSRKCLGIYRQKIGMLKRKTSMSGENNPFYGKTHNNKTKQKLSKLAKLRIGNKASNWRGGLSFLPYPITFNTQLKDRIRVRDNFHCQLCGVPELECNQKLEIHHIDYVKKNCDISNLVSLCSHCHKKTNGNRDYWKDYFVKSMEKIS